jgi:hypothetical protein
MAKSFTHLNLFLWSDQLTFLIFDLMYVYSWVGYEMELHWDKGDEIALHVIFNH